LINSLFFFPNAMNRGPRH